MIFNCCSLFFGGLLACNTLRDLFIDNLHMILLISFHIILHIEAINAASATTKRIRTISGSSRPTWCRTQWRIAVYIRHNIGVGRVTRVAGVARVGVKRGTRVVRGR